MLTTCNITLCNFNGYYLYCMSNLLYTNTLAENFKNNAFDNRFYKIECSSLCVLITITVFTNHHLVFSGSNAILNVNVKNASHNLTIVKCELACFSSKLECVLYNITTNNIDVTSLIMNTTGNITGPLTSYNYPTQQITLTNLTSGTTYNYCVVGINVTNMMEVGDPVCGNFTTKNLTSTFTGAYNKMYCVYCKSRQPREGGA